MVDELMRLKIRMCVIIKMNKDDVDKQVEKISPVLLDFYGIDYTDKLNNLIKRMQYMSRYVNFKDFKKVDYILSNLNN